MSPAHSDDAWSRKLRQRAILELNPHAAIGIKRDVHNFVVDAPAAAMADAFHRAMRTPGKSFGLIEVRRLPENVGRPFQLGERFQGRYGLEAAVRRSTGNGLTGLIPGGTWLDAPLQKLVRQLEDGFLSDYGIVTELELSPARPEDGHRLRYAYLEGSPIAGSSTFEVLPCGPDRCRVRQVFEYQELRWDSVPLLSSVGLRLHNQVVASQISQSAGLIGARVLESDVPAAYWENVRADAEEALAV